MSPIVRKANGAEEVTHHDLVAEDDLAFVHVRYVCRDAT